MFLVETVVLFVQVYLEHSTQLLIESKYNTIAVVGKRKNNSISPTNDDLQLQVGN
jgi:hypothetical protein